jgi:L-fuculose-phosphate aldolase
VKIHACIYKLRPDVLSVVHIHPRYAILMSTLTGHIVPMCQEGAELVKEPLPIFPHVKTVQTDAEGMELAHSLGKHPAVLMQGHGVTTVGRSLAETVLGMAQIEEQARMNYLALAAMGPQYPRLPGDLVEEMFNREPLWEQPHFRDVLKGRPANREGIWAYHVRNATPNR